MLRKGTPPPAVRDWNDLDDAERIEVVGRVLELLDLTDEAPATTAHVRELVLWRVGASHRQVWATLSQGADLGYFVREIRKGVAYWRLG